MVQETVLETLLEGKLRVPLFLIAIICTVVQASATGGVPERIKAREGEMCIVCRQPVTAGAPGYLFEGQRVAVCPHEEAEFLADPQAVLASSRPNNILMSGRQRETPSTGWLWFAALMTLGVAAGGLLAHRRIQAAGVPAGQSKARLTSAPVVCAQCGRDNHPRASTCLSCGVEFSPARPSEAGNLRKY